MTLAPAETRLQAALTAYLDLARQGEAARAQTTWTGQLHASMESLETLAAELAPHLDPRLRHFLESKSYRKAHDYLALLAGSGLANSTSPRQGCSR